MTPEARERWRRRVAGEFVPIPDDASRHREKRACRSQIEAEFVWAWDRGVLRPHIDRIRAQQEAIAAAVRDGTLQYASIEASVERSWSEPD